jgi:hypothetical protein
MTGKTPSPLPNDQESSLDSHTMDDNPSDDVSSMPPDSSRTVMGGIIA